MPLTNQVRNVTEGNNSELSDEEAYAAEWERDDTSDQGDDDFTSTGGVSFADSDGNSNHGKAEETTTHSGTVGKGNQGGTNGSDNSSAESGVSDDIWAQATDAQRQAFTNAQNDLNRETSRAKSQQRLNADMQKELDKTKADYGELTRTKGTYEQEHPELFNEVFSRMKEVSGPAQNTAADEGDDGLPDDIKLVFKVHPDANDLMQTPEWGTFASSLTSAQTAQMESDDPFEFISLVSEFKTQRRMNSPTGSGLENTVTRSGGASSSASRSTTRSMTDDEAYAAEWALDD
jgi:hypothetical protein